jgi:hypothetical protein
LSFFRLACFGSSSVMAGLVTTTFYPKGKTWMPGTGPGMTKNRIRDLCLAEKSSETFPLA